MLLSVQWCYLFYIFSSVLFSSVTGIHVPPGHNGELLVQQNPMLGSDASTAPHDTTLDSQAISEAASPKPFYMIAHRVLKDYGIRDALNHGANAIEIDMMAFKKGWWACHDNVAGAAGDTARTMFETIAAERRAGKTVTFVWLDIKNADYCDPDSSWRICSIDELRDLARQILEPVGVRVLYGFYEASGKAFFRTRDSLASHEAINLNGIAMDVSHWFSFGPSQVSKRIMSYGWWNLADGFGDCSGDKAKTCTQLHKAVQSRQFGKVFGWTSTSGQGPFVEALTGYAGIDGIIYGRQLNHYYDKDTTRAAAQDVLAAIGKHSDKVYLAKQEDKPW